ncbi:RNA-splicing ligase RtcB [archaeon]|nr:RNA-splicing ligase RtcB [archaeon]
MIPKSGGMKVPAYLFASEKLLELIKQDKTLDQIKNVAHLPGIYKHALCMPDGHQGYGFPIGGVAALDYHEGGISPGGIGYDINCGVRLMRTSFTYEDVKGKMKELISELFNNVPSGVGVDGVIGKLSKAELKKVLNNGSKWALKNGYATEDDLNNTEDNGRLDADAELVSQKAISRGRSQLGSLGAGNHFLEVQRVGEVLDEPTAKAFGLKKDHITVMIHCGSRGLGHQVCSDYVRLMEQSNPGLVKSLPDRELVYAPAGSKVADNYLKAMSAAANFAWCNRQVIAHYVRKSFKKVLGSDNIKQVYDLCHNICKVEEHDGKKLYLHRKGATRCMPKGHRLVPDNYKSVGQPVLIPGTMGTVSYVLVGLESSLKESFGSTAHGAGRVMSRTKAKKQWRAEKVKEKLSGKGIVIKSKSYKGISEEAPGAYKDVDEVVRVSQKAGIAKPVAKLKPLGVIKG